MASPSPFTVERLRRTTRIAWSTTIWVEVALPPFSTLDLSPPPSSENEWISQLSYHGICCSYQLPQMSSEILWHISFPHRSHSNPPFLSHPFNQSIPGSQAASSRAEECCRSTGFSHSWSDWGWEGWELFVALIQFIHHLLPQLHILQPHTHRMYFILRSFVPLSQL